MLLNPSGHDNGTAVDSATASLGDNVAGQKAPAGADNRRDGGEKAGNGERGRAPASPKGVGNGRDGWAGGELGASGSGSESRRSWRETRPPTARSILGPPAAGLDLPLDRLVAAVEAAAAAAAGVRAALRLSAAAGTDGRGRLRYPDGPARSAGDAIASAEAEAAASASAASATADDAPPASAGGEKSELRRRAAVAAARQRKHLQRRHSGPRPASKAGFSEAAGEGNTAMVEGRDGQPRRSLSESPSRQTAMRGRPDAAAAVAGDGGGGGLTATSRELPLGERLRTPATIRDRGLVAAGTSQANCALAAMLET